MIQIDHNYIKYFILKIWVNLHFSLYLCALKSVCFNTKLLFLAFNFDRLEKITLFFSPYIELFNFILTSNK